MPHQAASIPVVLVGCGAISELFYAPALSSLAPELGLSVISLVDPNHERLAVLAKAFPASIQLNCLDNIRTTESGLAIVASPQRFHAEQTITLLRKGFHVLCEKPLASNRDEALTMVKTAQQCKRLLAVGLFRRFWPIVEFITDLITAEPFGRPLSFSWSEGGEFDWPAASPSFFQKSTSPGGVFADLGAHVLDLLILWFGKVADYDYLDDAMGGIEANSFLTLTFASGVTGCVRLSRDTSITNRVQIEFENVTLEFTPGNVSEVSLLHRTGKLKLIGSLYQVGSKACSQNTLKPVRSYAQSFMEQIKNICYSMCGSEALQAPAEAAVESIELIDRCYASRRMLPMPWLTHEERSGAALLIQ